MPKFICIQESAPHSPHLNPPDYLIRDILQARYELFASLQDLQNAIKHKWNEVNDHAIWKSMLQLKKHLTAVTKQNGVAIQHIFCSAFRLMIITAARMLPSIARQWFLIICHWCYFCIVTCNTILIVSDLI